MTRLLFPIAAWAALAFAGAAMAQARPAAQTAGSQTSTALGQDTQPGTLDYKTATLKGIQVVRTTAGPKIEIKISPAVKPTVITLTGPDRLVFDFENTVSAFPHNRIVVNHDGVKAIRIGLRSGTPLVTRVVLDLESARSYELVMSKLAVSVSLGPPVAAPTSASNSGPMPAEAASAEQDSAAANQAIVSSAAGSSLPDNSAKDSQPAEPATPAHADPAPATAVTASANDAPAPLKAAPGAAEEPKSAAGPNEADSGAAAEPATPATSSPISSPENTTTEQAQAAAPAPEEPKDPAGRKQADSGAATQPAAPAVLEAQNSAQPASAPANPVGKQQADAPRSGNAFLSSSQAQSGEGTAPASSIQGAAPAAAQTRPEKQIVLAAADPASSSAASELTATTPTDSSLRTNAAAKPDMDPSLTQQKGVNPNEYLIGEQDQLTIVVWGEPALSGPVAVRPDGKITVPLVNEIKVAGLTPMQLQNLLAERLKPFINMPQVTVVVRQINSRNVYLIGQAGREGMFPINSSTTVLQLIAEAGGLRDFAKRKGIYVLRNVRGRQVRLPFNYDQVIRGVHSEQNIVLLPGDTVVVP